MAVKAYEESELKLIQRATFAQWAYAIESAKKQIESYEENVKCDLIVNDMYQAELYSLTIKNLMKVLKELYGKKL